MLRSARIYYVLYGLYWASAWFVAPMYALFLLDRGLDLLEINTILAVYLLTVFVFEVPTGAVADLLGRKASFLLSCGIRVVAYSLYASAEGFAGCLVAEVVDGVGTTLASGALEAWAVDEMKEEGHRGPTDGIFARAHFFSRILMIVSGIAGGYIAAESFSAAWRVGAGGFLVTMILAACWMREARRADPLAVAVTWRSLTPAIGEGVRMVLASPMLRVLCLLTLALSFAALPAHMYWPPRLSSLSGEGVWLMGWIWAGLNLMTAIASAALPRLLARSRRETVLAFSVAWRALTLALAAAATSFVPALLGFLLQEASYGLNEPVLQAWTNEHISPERRATVLSIRSMFMTLGGSLGLVTIGFVARGYGIPLAWGASALVFALLVPGFLYLGRVAGRPVRVGPIPEPEPRPGRVVPPAGS